MPIYEYRCTDCRRVLEVFLRSMNSTPSAPSVCPRCGSSRLQRLISRTFVHRSGERNADDLAGLEDDVPDDPKEMARWLRRASAEMGEDGGPELEEAMERLEAGESLEGDDDGATQELLGTDEQMS